MPGFISSIKAKLPSMSIKSPLATPAVESAEPPCGVLAPGPELTVPPPEETTPAPAGPDAETDAKSEAPVTDTALHVPGELPIASTSSLALADPATAPALASSPAPAPALAPEPEMAEQAPEPAPVLLASEPEPPVETVVVGPITGGEPGLSEPVPGVSPSSPEKTTAEGAVDTPAEPSEPVVQVPATADPVEAPQPTDPVEVSQPAESLETPAPAETIEASAAADSAEASLAQPHASPVPPVASLAFPQAQPEGEAKENVVPRGMGRTIRQSIRRLGRSSDKVPSRKSLDPSTRQSMEAKAGAEGAPRKSVDVPALAEEDEGEAPGVERKKVPLGDKLKGVFEEVKGRVKKNPEGIAYGKALRTGDLNV